MITAADQSPIDSSALEEQAYDWVVRFASGEANGLDLDGLKRWMAKSPDHAAAFDRVSRSWQAIGQVPAEAFGGTADISRAAPPRVGRRVFLGGALAASAAGAAVMVARPPLELWPTLSELGADFRTDVGERRQLKLFGDVAIDMNTRTSIAMRTTSQAPDRIELLSGEAMVATSPSVAADVTVVAGDGQIVAREARFNIRHAADAVCVTCLAGEVRVELGGANAKLPAGSQLTYSGERLGAVKAVDGAVVAAWQGGYLVFQSTPVADVVAELNRYRRGKIILTNAALGRERFSARLRVENVDRVIDQLVQAFGAHATALPGRIVLLG
ncbi:FecR family protein [Tardiphaga sp. 172_B4_N1_3]|uniref:FecR family protein n=1 Tax=Tardiphaga sp. 172_B4_N1_3 TaxID=3240787 RepID=UPI003F896872